ncbi:MAG: hypothetical protein BGO59_25195 [Spirosoma sp. 48-14]|nr:MAG: hypothetical protein BGO59_25195 [Spirosoma sp. 48-14]
MVLTTSMAREYVSFLQNKEVTKSEFENMVNKRRHKDKFGFEPTVGEHNANCYTYAAIFQLWEVEPMEMPSIDFTL